MRKMTITIVLACCIGLTSCYRTTYKNLGGTLAPTPAVSPNPPVTSEPQASAWQHFFLFGWVPTQEIRAGEICQSSGGVQEIQTRQTFLQGFLAAICSFYVNIYSPYNGQVVCADGSGTN